MGKTIENGKWERQENGNGIMKKKMGKKNKRGKT
jgi:hypothetical protein